MRATCDCCIFSKICYKIAYPCKNCIVRTICLEPCTKANEAYQIAWKIRNEDGTVAQSG